MNTAIEERIRTRAYELWEAEGRPDGREIDHWLQAVHDVAAGRPADGRTAAPRSRVPGKAAASAVTAPAPKAKSSKTAATATARKRTPAAKGS